jgi:hypothetical protein
VDEAHRLTHLTDDLLVAGAVRGIIRASIFESRFMLVA